MARHALPILLVSLAVRDRSGVAGKAHSIGIPALVAHGNELPRRRPTLGARGPALVGFMALARACAPAEPSSSRGPHSVAVQGRIVEAGVRTAPQRADDATTRPDAAAIALGSESGARPPDDMILVPGGTLVMGTDSGGEDDEHPAHRVTIRSFFLDRTEVTNRAYAVCVGAGKCRPPERHDGPRDHLDPDDAFRAPEQPVSSISWDDARAYCAFVGKRLPTEAEFERAARGDDARTYPWGNEPPSPERAVYATTRTADVGTHPAGAGPYGHQDLSGNVWEWIDDVYDPYAYRRPSAARGAPGTCAEVLAAQDALRRSGRRGFTGSNPIPTECEHVLRGGAFNYGAAGLRATNRVHHPGRFRLVMSGVRCAKDV